MTARSVSTGRNKFVLREVSEKEMGRAGTTDGKTACVGRRGPVWWKYTQKRKKFRNVLKPNGIEIKYEIRKIVDVHDE